MNFLTVILQAWVICPNHGSEYSLESPHKQANLSSPNAIKASKNWPQFLQQPQRVLTAKMKFATGFIVSILTASVYGLATAPNAREYADIEVRYVRHSCYPLTIHLLVDSRDAQVPPKPVVILVMPSHSCARTAQHKSTISTRRTLQNCGMLSPTSDIATKALPATSSRTKNPTQSLFTDSIMVK